MVDERVRTDAQGRIVERDVRSDGGGRTALIIILLLALAALAAYALGLFNVDASGDLKAPEVEVSGGEVPDVQVETADVTVGEEPVTVDVPTVDVEPVGDDGSANR